MARKELVISIKAVDQISGPIRSTMNAIGRLGRKAIQTSASVLRGMGGLAKSLLSVKTLLAGVAAAFAVRGLVRSITSVATALDETAKSARALGIEVEEYSKLQFVAERSGIAVKQLATAFRTAQRNAAQYVRGEGGAAQRAFSDLGASLTDANGRIRQGTDLLNAILVPMNKIQDEAVKTQKLYDIFGRTGAQFKNIGEDMTKLLSDADRYGQISASQTRVAEVFRDSLTNLSRAWTFLRASVLEAIGPALTRTINTAAEKMADFGRLVSGVFQVFVDTANDPDTRLEIGNALSRMLGAATDIVVVGIQAMVRTVGVVIQNSIEPLMILIRNTLGPSLGNVIIETVGEALASVWDWLGRADNPNAFTKFFEGLAQDTREGIAFLKEELAAGGDLRKEFDDSLSAAFTKSGSQVVRDIDGILNDAFSRIHQISSRDFGGVTSVIDQLVKRLREVREQISNETDTPGENWGASFAAGVRQAAEAVGEVNAQFQKLGADVFNTVGNQISGGLTDLVTGAASAKDAFRDMAQGILKDLARLTIRMAVFNALAAAVGGFGKAPTGNPAVGATGPAPFVKSGGIMRAGGHVRRYVRGGMVPGPNINRDMVPALLAPGEGVLNRRAVQRVGPRAVHAMNRGESIGGGITIHQHNHFDGQVSKSTARQSTEMLMAALLDAMRRHPAFRDQVRSMVT
ncbi:MAG: hypothetical protein NCW75_05530 [Phycisphaera sp.]|nr:MAG: hypothetical protein NCW75_05530 [Phycisphaera sp.]